LIDRQLGPGAEADFYRSMAGGDLAVEVITAADWLRIAELVDTYADLRLGGVDASLVAVAERLGVKELGTLDLRHFRVVRPRHVEVFALLP
jgi:predicted nucleic acid-binding protein